MLRSLPAVGHPIRFRTLIEAILRNGKEGRFIRELSPDSPFFLVCSGTAALTLSLRSLRHNSEKKEVLIPAYTCPSIVVSVIKAGLEPVLCDLKPYDFQMDLDHLASKIGPNSLAVIAVHLFGIPENITDMKTLTRDKGIFLLEDAAQAFGNKLADEDSSRVMDCSSSPAGKHLGSFGDTSIVSFGRGKPLSLLSGGAVIVNNSELYEIVQKTHQSLPDSNRWRFLSQYFLSLLLYSLLYHPRLYWMPQSMPWLRLGETIVRLNFDVTKIGPKVINLGNILFEKFREIRKVRLDLMKLYKEKLAQFQEEFEFFPDYDGDDTVLLRFPIIFKRRQKREKILSYLEGKGLGATGSFPAPLNELEGTHPYLSRTESYPIAKFISERILTLPLHEYVTTRDVENIAKTVASS